MSVLCPQDQHGARVRVGGGTAITRGSLIISSSFRMLLRPASSLLHMPHTCQSARRKPSLKKPSSFIKTPRASPFSPVSSVGSAVLQLLLLLSYSVMSGSEPMDCNPPDSSVPGIF